jgi:hypothetical protein
MMKTLLAAAAAFALASAVPAYAGCPNCAECPEHKNKVAAADKAEQKEGTTKTACGCPTNEKGECKCGAKCECGHCHPKADKKDDAKKTT